MPRRNALAEEYQAITAERLAAHDRAAERQKVADKELSEIARREIAGVQARCAKAGHIFDEASDRFGWFRTPFKACLFCHFIPKAPED